MPEEKVAVGVGIDLDMSIIVALEKAPKFKEMQPRNSPSMHLQERAFRRPR
jgi:hypothetical protein